MKTINNKGIGHHLMLLLLALLILGISGFAGWIVYRGGFSALADNDNSVKNKYFSNCPPEIDKRPSLKVGYKDSNNKDKASNKCGRALQFYLKTAAGYQLDIDGWFGPQTEDRVKKLQTKYNLVDSKNTEYGVANKATWLKLEALHQELATKLKKEYKGPLSVWYDANTENPASGVDDKVSIDTNNLKYKKPLLIGASYTVGMKAQGNLREKFSEASIPIKIVAKGGKATINGKESAKNVLKDQRKKGYNPDIIMIQTGINDLGLSEGFDESKNYTNYKKWINEMMDEIDTSNKLPVIWFTLTREREKTKPNTYNKVLRETQVARPNLTLVDWVPTIEANPQWYTNDGVHYSKDGYLARASCTVKAFKLFYGNSTPNRVILC